MTNTLRRYIYIFVFFSLAGWFLEFFFRSLKGKKLIKPGLLRGPYLPIYGSGAVLLTWAISFLGNASILTKILSYFALTTGSEFITGYIFEKYFHLRLWDYSTSPFNIKGHICPLYSLFWVILAFAFEYFFLPFALTLYEKNIYISYLANFLSLVIFIDFTTKMYSLMKKEGKKIEHRDDFSSLAAPLLAHPQVAKLAHLPHHRTTTRLEHSLEVARLSYAIARKFSLDLTAVVRGALLHDLFYYDWSTEGPRLHGPRHPRICLYNARKVTSLTPREEDIILKHMWPLTFFPPRYAETWIVCLVDTYCTIKDYLVHTKTLSELKLAQKSLK